MTTLSEKLLNDDDRPSVIDDCVALIDAEVASKKGIGGLAIKTAFKTVKAVKPGVIPDAVNFLLDDFVEKLEPFYGQFTQSDESDLTSYIVRHADQVADSLLGITDARAQKVVTKRSSRRTQNFALKEEAGYDRNAPYW